MISASLGFLVSGVKGLVLAREYVANYATQLCGPNALHMAVAYNNGVEFVPLWTMNFRTMEFISLRKS
jgi:hypothetical protein